MPQRALEYLHMTADDHQQIIEIMRDTSGELPESLHLLRIGQLFPGALQLQLSLAPLRVIAGDLGEANQLSAVVHLASPPLPQMPLGGAWINGRRYVMA